MAWTFPDLWINPYSSWGMTDGRSFHLTTGAGSSVNTAPVFDYFTDTAAVGQTIMVGLSSKFWGVKFYVGTALVADSITVVWEYLTASTTWATLKVENPYFFLSTGEQIVRFTPPPNWTNTNQGYGGYTIRCRITAVTNITEGGANSTQMIYLNIKPLQTTGTETTLNTAITGDAAGSYTTLTAVTPAASLTPLDMPVLDLGATAKLDVVLAGCTLGAGDTVVLTGIDYDNAALIETIDVSGGNATYTTTQNFKNVTDVACNGFADGTIEVRQKKWGIISLIGGAYTLRTYLRIGDGSTATTTTLNNHKLNFSYGFYWMTEVAATFNCGVSYGSFSRYGSQFFESIHVNSLVQWRRDRGTVLHYGCTYMTYTGGTQFPWFDMNNANTVFQDCTWAAASSGEFRPRVALTLKRCRFYNVSLWFNSTLSASTADVGGNVASRAETSVVTVNFDAFNLPSMALWLYNTSIQNYIDCPMDSGNYSVGYGSMGTTTRQLRILKRFDLKVIDGAGNAIAGATVKIVDTEGTVFATLTTDGNGDIAEQKLWYKAASHTNPNNFFTWETFTPHTITISKPGYQTKTLKLTMDRKREEIEVLEKVLDMNLSKHAYLANQ